MANDLGAIEIPVIFNDKQLKSGINTVNRLERELARLAKAVDSNNTTEERYRQTLIKAGRELKAVTQLTGTQAYGAVVKYTNAKQKQIAATKAIEEATRKEVAEQKRLADEQKRSAQAVREMKAALDTQRRAQMENTAALTRLRMAYDGNYAVEQRTLELKRRLRQEIANGNMTVREAGAELLKYRQHMQQFNTAQMAATKANNRFGVVTQQAGYQVGDFLVQIQSGTNPMVAFGQQATQLVGILPLMGAGFMGLSAGALVALSAGLGIAIPLVTAIGAAFMRSRESSNTAKEGVDELAKVMENLKGTSQSLEVELAKMKFGVESSEMAAALIQQEILTRKVAEAQEAYAEALKKSAENEYSLRAAGVAGRAAEELQAAEKKLRSLKDEIDLLKQRSEEERKAREDREWLLRNQENQLDAALEYFDAFVAGQKDAYDEAEKTRKVYQDLTDEIGKAAVDALKLANIDISKGVSAAARSAAILAANMGISLNAAISMQNMASGKVYSGRGSGAEYNNTPDYTKELGYVSVEELIAKMTPKVSGASKATRELKKELSDAEKAALEFAKAMNDTVIGAVDGVANAFADFIMRGFQDFKSFTKDIIGSFAGMLKQMIFLAARNKIMIGLGASFSGVGGMAAAGAGGMAAGAAGGMLGGIGAGIGAMGTGLAGIFSGGGLGASFANLGGLLSGSVSGLGAIGAAIPAIGLVVLGFSALIGKTKELDSGLKVTVGNMDALTETFRTIEKSRFFGLSKKTSTKTGGVSNEVSDPIVQAVQAIQQSVLDAAAVFGIAEKTFDNFSYNFQVSLKGLTEEQKMQKINEELTKMGDSFASLTGHFETMNELLEAVNQRMELQNRLDTLLGNNAAVLARQREAELAAMHELNRPLAQAIYGLEDAQAAVTNAFAGLRAAIDKVVSDLREKLTVANEAVNRSRSIFNQLESALSGRYVSSGISQMFSRREGALSFIRGGDFSDEKKLEEALKVVGEPTEDLYGSFEEYAREFYTTSNVIEGAKKVAEAQLTEGEKQVALLEKQIADAEAQYQTQVDQYNALLGIDTSVKSVTEAIGTLRGAIEALAAAQSAAKAAAAAGGGGGASSGGAGAGVQAANEAGQKILGQLGQSGIAERATDGAKFQRIDIRGSQQLLDVARSLGVQTSGLSGAQIQQAISNAGNIGVGMDSATRAKRFAMGGYHTGGLRMVGERGPELEATGPSRIFSHNQTAGMFKDPELKDAVRGLREEVAGLRSEQRQIQMDISKYTKRSYDIERKWDVEGLPATRT